MISVFDNKLSAKLSRQCRKVVSNGAPGLSVLWSTDMAAIDYTTTHLLLITEADHKPLVTGHRMCLCLVVSF